MSLWSFWLSAGVKQLERMSVPVLGFGETSRLISRAAALVDAPTTVYRACLSPHMVSTYSRLDPDHLNSAPGVRWNLPSQSSPPAPRTPPCHTFTCGDPWGRYRVQ